MKHSQHFALMVATLLAGVAIAMPETRAAAFAGNKVSSTDPGFVPDTGQINRGFDEKVPTTSRPRPIPTEAQVRAAFDTLRIQQPAPRASAAPGSAAPTAQVPNPIGVTPQTMPAKFSPQQDILDRVPLMALPIPLSAQDRQRIYRAVMTDKRMAAGDAAKLAPASELNANQALNETYPLPGSVRGIRGVQKLAYIKTKNKVFLVEPDTRIIVDEIDS